MNGEKSGPLAPFRQMFREKGALMMIIVAFIYSITSNFGKMGVLYSSPSFFAASYYSALAMVIFSMNARRGFIAMVAKKELIFIGLASALMITFHMLAIRLVVVPYMISLKRSSLLISIILGGILFHEKGMAHKLAGRHHDDQNSTCRNPRITLFPHAGFELRLTSRCSRSIPVRDVL